MAREPSPRAVGSRFRECRFPVAFLSDAQPEWSTCLGSRAATMQFTQEGSRLTPFSRRWMKDDPAIRLRYSMRRSLLAPSAVISSAFAT